MAAIDKELMVKDNGGTVDASSPLQVNNPYFLDDNSILVSITDTSSKYAYGEQGQGFKLPLYTRNGSNLFPVITLNKYKINNNPLKYSDAGKYDSSLKDQNFATSFQENGTGIEIFKVGSIPGFKKIFSAEYQQSDDDLNLLFSTYRIYRENNYLKIDHMSYNTSGEIIWDSVISVPSSNFRDSVVPNKLNFMLQGAGGAGGSVSGWTGDGQGGYSGAFSAGTIDISSTTVNDPVIIKTGKYGSRPSALNDVRDGIKYFNNNLPSDPLFTELHYFWKNNDITTQSEIYWSFTALSSNWRINLYDLSVYRYNGSTYEKITDMTYNYSYKCYEWSYNYIQSNYTFYLNRTDRKTLSGLGTIIKRGNEYIIANGGCCGHGDASGSTSSQPISGCELNTLSENSNFSGITSVKGAKGGSAGTSSNTYGKGGSIEKFNIVMPHLLFNLEVSKKVGADGFSTYTGGGAASACYAGGAAGTTQSTAGSVGMYGSGGGGARSAIGGAAGGTGGRGCFVIWY